MFQGIGTLLGRALMRDLRSPRMHALRLGYLFSIYFMMMSVQATVAIGAPGLNFFRMLCWWNAIAVCFGTIGLFATAIAEEKEERTLGLLVMAGINPVGILLGKATARMLQVLLLLTLQFPFTLLSITLGGITLSQVFAAYLGLFAFTVLFANVGLLASVIARRTGTAAGMAGIALGLYAMLPALAPGGFVSPWFTSTTIFTRLSTIFNTGFDESPWSWQVLTNLGGGLVTFLLAWACFGRFALNADDTTTQRGWMPVANRRFTRLSPGRVWSRALAWKDFHFIGGGWPGVWLRVAAYGVSFLIAGAMSLWAGWPQRALVEGLIFPHLGFVLTGMGLEASYAASRLFHDELREQTMSSLYMLPRSLGWIAYSKVLGCLISLLPAAAFTTFDIAFLGVTGNLNWNGQALVVIIGSTLAVTVFLHLVVLISLFVKWGALPLAFFAMFLSMYCCPLLWLLMIAAASGFEWFLVAGWFYFLVYTATLFVFQSMIHARLYELGTK